METQLKINFWVIFIVLYLPIVGNGQSLRKDSIKYDTVSIQHIKLAGAYIYEDEHPNNLYSFKNLQFADKKVKYLNELDDYDGMKYYYGDSYLSFIRNEFFDSFSIQDKNLVLEIDSKKIRVGDSIDILKEKYYNSFNTYLKNRDNGFIILLLNKTYISSNIYIEVSKEMKIQAIRYIRL